MELKNRLFLFWNIGKNVVRDQNNYANCLEKYSEYYQYKYGVTMTFSRENIYFMKQFYLSFPIYYEKLNYLDWDIYVELLKLDKEYRYFYFYLGLLFKYNLEELKNCIMCNFYDKLTK